MIKQVKITTTDGIPGPTEGFCWEIVEDFATEGFCVLFGVPTWSVEATA